MVDYFVVPTAYLSRVRELLVSEELAVADHSGLVILLYCVTPVCILKKKHRARHG